MMTKETKLQIEKTLVVGTVHIAVTDAEKMDRIARSDRFDATGLVIVESEHWYQVHVDIPSAELKRRAMRAGLTSVCIEWLLVARKNGCTFCRFDQDGPEYASAATFEW
jgi:hypothetical protein